jgi:hypothetical protein
MSTRETDLDFLEKAHQLANDGRLALPVIEHRKKVLKIVMALGALIALFAYVFPASTTTGAALLVYDLLLWVSFGVVVISAISMFELYFQELLALRVEKAYSIAEAKDAVGSLSVFESRVARLTQDLNLNLEIESMVMAAIISDGKEKGKVTIEKAMLEARLHEERVGARCVKLLASRVFTEVA